jgi:hypothetical protein
MRLVNALMVLSVLAPHPAVYVKGHSHAANIVRERIEAFTCYRSGEAPENSVAVLHVDHVVSKSGRTWLVMVLVDRERNVLYERKAEEYPWPILSSLNGLLKTLARSTCPGYQRSRVRKSADHPIIPPPQARTDASVR